MGVGFAGFVDKFSGASAPFLGSIVVSSHESKPEVEEVMCRFW